MISKSGDIVSHSLITSNYFSSSRLISTNPAELKRLETEIAEMNLLDAKTALRKDSELAEAYVKVGQALGDDKMKISKNQEANDKAASL